MKKIIKLSLFTIVLLIAPNSVNAEEDEIRLINEQITDKIIQYQFDYIKNKDLKKSFMEFMNEKEDFKSKDSNFKDVKSSEWFYQDLVFANRYGLVKGKGAKDIFAPQDKLTRAEAASVLTRESKEYTRIYSGVEIPIDLDKKHWAFAVMMVMNIDGVIEGYPDKTVKPDKTVTRAEFVSMLDKVISGKIHLKQETENIPDVNFKDVAKTDWYYNSLRNVSNSVGISGYEDGTFKPNETITRAEMVVMMTRYLDYIMKATKEIVK